MAQPGRIVRFRVSGTIRLRRPLTIFAGNLTIDGSDAPDAGVQIADAQVSLRGGNTIVTHMRFRNGNRKAYDDGLTLEDGSNYLIDHVSCQWGTDECISAVAYEGRSLRNFTIQYSIIAQTLPQSRNHTYGTLVAGDVSLGSWVRNVFAHQYSRNPQLTPGSDHGSPERGVAIFTVEENVIHNYQIGSIVGSFSQGWHVYADFVRNVYLSGSNRIPPPVQRIGVGTVGLFLSTNRFYSGNHQQHEFVSDRTKGGIDRVTRDAGFLMKRPVGVDLYLETDRDVLQETVREAGATKPCRDSLDQSLLLQVTGQTGKRATVRDNPAELGGYPDLRKKCMP